MAGIVQYIFVIYLSCNCLGKDFLLCVLNDTIYGDMVTKAIGLYQVGNNKDVCQVQLNKFRKFLSVCRKRNTFGTLSGFELYVTVQSQMPRAVERI